MKIGPWDQRRGLLSLLNSVMTYFNGDGKLGKPGEAATAEVVLLDHC